MATRLAGSYQVPCAPPHTAAHGLPSHGDAMDVFVASKQSRLDQDVWFGCRLTSGRFPVRSSRPPACTLPGASTTLGGGSAECSCSGQEELRHLRWGLLRKFDDSTTLNRSHMWFSDRDGPISRRGSQKGRFRSRPLRSVRAEAISADDERPGSTESEAVASTSGRADLSTGALGGDGATLRDTRELVEVAMLAATTGLAYALSTLLRLEGYFATFFPLPLVVAAIRGNVRAAVKTLVATTLLLFVLTGPLRAVLYVVSYGSLGLAMGAGWRLRVRWLPSVLLLALVRVASLLASLAVSSWLLRENIPRLILTQFHASLTAMFHTVGLPSGPSMPTVCGIASAALLFNSASYVFLLHILYTILLKRLGLQVAPAAPAWVVKAGGGPANKR
ncbi:hypothetical protein KFL_008840030 [Klebsormidium nitens]|uniref:Uncharacterized protein n=1 Tax=Klebsormidium nitens TaxID=105231 RepID=A0A1Y1IR26_KLENI|nr:hypothetical protein KFL_008840030 [Klebsormidium nitens]|eukprot:GAQ91929.1 hypothetical protein KFL_008840030 [Klebsormidium nitens]